MNRADEKHRRMFLVLRDIYTPIEIKCKLVI